MIHNPVIPLSPNLSATEKAYTSEKKEEEKADTSEKNTAKQENADATVAVSEGE